MLVSFQLILLVIIVISFMGVIGEQEPILKEKMLITFLGGLSAFLISVFWF